MSKGLILIDIQNDYFPDGKMPLVGIEQAAANAGRLLDQFREKGLPTFHIQHIFQDPNAPFFLPETKGVEIHPSLAPEKNETVIVKHYPNSFRESALLGALRKAGAEEVVICGAMSHMCVDATTRAAADFGLKCTLAHDACATTNLEFAGKKIGAEEVHGSYMSALGWAYAELVGTEDYLKRGD
jgi:nicotinamidase-related amidase